MSLKVVIMYDAGAPNPKPVVATFDPGTGSIVKIFGTFDFGTKVWNQTGFNNEADGFNNGVNGYAGAVETGGASMSKVETGNPDYLPIRNGISRTANL